MFVFIVRVTTVTMRPDHADPGALTTDQNIVKFTEFSKFSRVISSLRGSAPHCHWSLGLQTTSKYHQHDYNRL